jgi:hypothetical protein
VLGKVFKFFWDFFMNLYPRLSVFIRVQKSSEFVGATQGSAELAEVRVARAEFGVKGDKALVLN